MRTKSTLGLLGIVFVLPVIGAIAGIKFLQIRTLVAMGPQTQPPSAVSVGEVKSEQWEQKIPSVGSVVAFQGVTLSAEAEGTVKQILFDPGAVVDAGQVLVRLDTDVEQAQLRAAEANAELAKTNLARAKDLYQSKTISKAELDTAEASLKQNVAQADNMRAIIARKTITAPFAGRLGIRLINVGQFLNKGNAIVSLQALNPVFVEFSLPQQWIGTIAEGFNIHVTSDAYPEKEFEGRITAINPDIDPVTRNVRMQATLQNPAGELRPGMYVSADVILPKREDVLAVPATSVVATPYGNTIFVVVEGEAGPDGKKPLTVDMRTVRLGQRRGDFVAITSGLKAGEHIVTNGGFKLRQGASIIESTIGVTEPSLDPKPANT